jgi:hypothetical protein
MPVFGTKSHQNDQKGTFEIELFPHLDSKEQGNETFDRKRKTRVF